LPLNAIQVLLVDDDVDTRNLIAFALKQAGATVTEADSATAALTALGQARFDVLVSDIGMPNIDGYALIRQIRAQPQGKTLPAIALTAYAGEKNQQMALAAGFQTHVSKPVEPAELVAIVAHLIEPIGGNLDD
jgi:CheY-like chemotaxis protein